MATRRLGGIATSSSVPDNGGDHSGGGGGSSNGYALIGKGLELDVTNPGSRYKLIEVLKVTPSGEVSLHQEYDTETDPAGTDARVSAKGAVRVLSLIHI